MKKFSISNIIIGYFVISLLVHFIYINIDLSRYSEYYVDNVFYTITNVFVLVFYKLTFLDVDVIIKSIFTVNDNLIRFITDFSVFEYVYNLFSWVFTLIFTVMLIVLKVFKRVFQFGFKIAFIIFIVYLIYAIVAEIVANLIII